MASTVSTMQFTAVISILLFCSDVHPKDVAFVEQPHNVTAHVGQTTMMQCSFDQHVNCQWMRGGTTLTIDNTCYRYADDTGGVQTKNCSLLINEVGKYDFTYWECFTQAPSQIMSEPGFLKEQKSLHVKVIDVGSGKFVDSIQVQKVENQIFVCGGESNSVANYSWQHSESHDADAWVEIKNSYILLTNLSHGYVKCSAAYNGTVLSSNVFQLMDDKGKTQVSNGTDVVSVVTYTIMTISLSVNIILLVWLIVGKHITDGNCCSNKKIHCNGQEGSNHEQKNLFSNQASANKVFSDGVISTDQSNLKVKRQNSLRIAAIKPASSEAEFLMSTTESRDNLDNVPDCSKRCNNNEPS